MSEVRNKLFTVKALEEEEMTFEGYLSTFENEDRVGDIIERGAFTDSVNKKATVPMLFNHKRDEVIGKMELSVDAIGLRVKGFLSPAVERAKEVYELMKFGAIDSMSVGMMIKDYEPIDKTKPWGAWLIKSADVLEGSVVTIPANDKAVVTSVKDLDEGERKELEKLRLERKKQAIRDLIQKMEGN